MVQESVSSFVLDAQDCKMFLKELELVPGLYQILDEILVNACDNQHRVPELKLGRKSLPKSYRMQSIKVRLDLDHGLVEIENDGAGIPVVLHATENMYVPELVFGHLLTSSNYDDTNKSTL